LHFLEGAQRLSIIIFFRRVQTRGAINGQLAHRLAANTRRTSR